MAIRKLYVGNLPFSVDDQRLADTFTPFGPVTSAQVVIKPDGRSSGFGFVEMEEDGAQKAIDQLNGSSLEGRTINVDYKKDGGKSGGGSRGDDRGPRRGY